MTPTPTPIPAPSAPRTHAAQDKAMGIYITLAGTILTTALTNASIADILGLRSYIPAKIGIGVALQNASQVAYNERQSALGGRISSVDEQGTFFDEEVAEFNSFRELARSFFPEQGDRTDLNLIGKTPDDMSLFVTMARTSYTNAKGAKFQVLLDPVGYSVEKLDEELTELATFETLISGRQGAGGTAKISTANRNNAFRALKKWMDQFEAVAKNALGPQIALLPFHDLPKVSLPKLK